MSLGRSLAVGPEISVLGSENLRRVVGIDFHEIRKQLNALLGMWEESLPTGTISSIIQKRSWRRDSLSTVPTGLVMIPRMLYRGKKNGVLGRNGRQRQSDLTNCGNRTQLLSFLPKCSQESNKMKCTFSYSICSHRMM